MPLIESIPEKYEDGFKELANLDSAQFEKFVAELVKLPFVSSISRLASNLSEVEELELIEVEEILSSVGGLIAAIDKEEIVDEIASDIVLICEALEIISSEDVDSFAKKVNFLLKNEQVYYASKADSLINNYGNSFLQSRVISDIRMVFDYQLEQTPKAGVILHSLNIHYQSNEEPFHKDITLVLNSNDIASLKESLIRAENKEKSLLQLFEKANITNLKG